MIISNKKILLIILFFFFPLNPHKSSTLHIFIRSFFSANPQHDFTVEQENFFLLLLFLFCYISTATHENIQTLFD